MKKKLNSIGKLVAFLAIALLVLIFLASNFGSELVSKAFGWNVSDVRRVARNLILIVVGVILALAGVSAGIPILAFAMVGSGLVFIWKGVSDWLNQNKMRSALGGDSIGKRG